MTYFGEHTPKLGFGMMRLPRTHGQIDIEETKKMVDAFMDAYKESVDFVNSDTEAAAQIIGDHDIIAKEVAQKAIPDCSIVFIEGDEMKTMLSGYLATLDDQNPEIIGGQLPDDAFYYKR